MTHEALLIEGEVEDPQVRKIARLELELRQVRRELSDAKVEADRAREDAARALGMLRKQLSPLYRALQAVFGELDQAGVEEAGSSPRGAAPTSRVSAIWQSWKTKLPGKPAEFIDILLEHGEMTHAQLKIAGRCGSDTVYRTITRMNGAGLINKNGGRFSLKQL